MIKHLLPALLLMASSAICVAQQPKVSWDAHSLIMDGHRVMPVMGEIHYSRIPEAEWAKEIKKMKEGGVTMIATYVFWNHVEEQEGIFNWSGQRDLRHFIELCAKEDIPVVLRLGPFCHGEVRNGGIPDWVFTKGCKTRDDNPVFMSYVKKLYRQIFAQVQGLQWKDGGPLIAVQFDNEQRNGAYLMALKKIALEIGYDLPFYTRTGWPALTRPVPFGEMLPLFGDYADGFWERSIKEGAGAYYKAFNFKAFRSSTAIATDQFGTQKAETAKGDNDYPYFTCELGGGMATAYHRRPYVYPEDAYSMAIVKLGSGSNLLGYYMYHGGTNPEGLTTLNENQRTQATNYNDMPVKTYDFQAPLGEFGQPYDHYFLLRKPKRWLLWLLPSLARKISSRATIAISVGRIVRRAIVALSSLITTSACRLSLPRRMCNSRLPTSPSHSVLSLSLPIPLASSPSVSTVCDTLQPSLWLAVMVRFIYSRYQAFL